MAGFTNDIMNADNVNFSGSNPTVGAVTANGQLMIGAASSPNIRIGTLTAGSGGIVITNGPGTITISTSGSQIANTITGNDAVPVAPSAGNWNILGSSPVAGTTPVTTSGAVSTLTVNVQKSQAIASTDATKIGLSAFDSSSFSVDSNGFVTLKGGSEAIDSIGVDASTVPGTNPVLPTVAGLVTITGGQVAAGTVGANVIRTDSLAANTLTVEIQRSTSNATTDSTKNGVSHYDSSKFTVDSNGFVSTSGTGVLNTLTGNSGGPISPTAGNINTLGTGSITIAGSGNTLTTQLTGLTNHNVLVGAGTATITKVSPSATSGIPLVSNGSSADPSFTTAVVAGGGTGSTSFNINGAVFSNTTTTGALQAATLTSGQLLIGGTTTPAAANLTAGAGITITNGNNSITIASTAGGFTWTDVTGATQTIAAQNGYVTDRGGGVTYTLPASGTLGDSIKIVGKLGLATVAQNANQQILIGSSSSTVGVGGSIAATNVGDCIELTCITSGASTVWRASEVVGNWTVT